MPEHLGRGGVDGKYAKTDGVNNPDRFEKSLSCSFGRSGGISWTCICAVDLLGKPCSGGAILLSSPSNRVRSTSSRAFGAIIDWIFGTCGSRRWQSCSNSGCDLNMSEDIQRMVGSYRTKSTVVLGVTPIQLTGY